MYSKRTGGRENRDFCKSPNVTSWRQGGPCRVIIRASSSGGRFYKSCRSDHSRMEQCRLSCSRSVSIPKFVFRLSSSLNSRWIDGSQEFLPVPVLSISRIFKINPLIFQKNNFYKINILDQHPGDSSARRASSRVKAAWPSRNVCLSGFKHKPVRQLKQRSEVPTDL